MSFLSSDLQKLRSSDAINFIQQQSKKASFVKLNLARPTYLISDPNDIRYILIKAPLAFNKSWFASDFKSFFGRGLFSSEGKEHRCQRKLLQPTLQKSAVASFVGQILKNTEDISSRWKNQQEINLVDQLTHMGALTMAKFVFDIDDELEAENVYRLAIRCHRSLCEKKSSRFQIPDFVPSRLNLRYKKDNKAMNSEVLKLLKRAQSTHSKYGKTEGTLINYLLKSEEPLTDIQIIDQLKTFAIVSADPIRTLGWSIYEAFNNKDIKRKIDAELQTLVLNEIDSASPFEKLDYINKVYSETIRKYPHTWILHRRANEALNLPSGHRLTKGADVFISPFVMHRKKEYFPNPEAFDPTRFENKQDKSWPNGAYLPFGLGPRGCIGEQFARLQANVTLAYLFKQFNFEFPEEPQYDTPNLFTMQPTSHIMKAVVSRV